MQNATQLALGSASKHFSYNTYSIYGTVGIVADEKSPDWPNHSNLTF